MKGWHPVKSSKKTPIASSAATYLSAVRVWSVAPTTSVHGARLCARRTVVDGHDEIRTGGI
jgi:hypothetical protein